jgi:hypothetical protein
MESEADDDANATVVVPATVIPPQWQGHRWVIRVRFCGQEIFLVMREAVPDTARK